MELVTTRYPHVFSDSGIPVAIKMTTNEYDMSKHQWTLLLTIFSLTLFPEIRSRSYKRAFDLMIADDVETRDCFTIESGDDFAQGIFPTALIPYGGMPDFGAKRVYGQSDVAIGSDTAIYDSHTEFNKQNTGFLLEGFAYGVVAKLKEMEDSGRVDAMLRKQEKVKKQKQEAAKLKAPAYRLARFAHDAGGDFTRKFALELLEMPIDPDKAKSAVLQEFGESLKEEYAGSVFGAKKMSLAVSYTDVKMDGKLIQGRATVLAMSLVSLSYNASMRRGKMSVRFNAGQEQEAREWIRRNIDALARDKNIALVTGRPPPEARYHLRGEKVDGDVMEIEFETE